MSKLVLTVRGGLGSRVYTLLCARIFTRHLGHDLEFFWPVETACACPFDLLFEDIGRRRGPVDLQAPGLHLEDSMGRTNAVIAKTLAEGRDVYFTTFYAHLQPEGMTTASFWQELHAEAARVRPVAAVRARVGQLSPGTIGLQIRRQDHWRNTRYSPLSLFFRVIDWTLQRDPTATFYLCTDSARVRRWMRWRYGERIGQREDLGERDNASGVQDALAEALTLAQAERVYRCNYGCFAALVDLLAGRPSIPTRLRRAPPHYHSRQEDRRHDELMWWDQKKLAWRGPNGARSFPAKLELWRYRLLTWFITSDFYQLWPFHAWSLKEVKGAREVAPGVFRPGPQSCGLLALASWVKKSPNEFRPGLNLTALVRRLEMTWVGPEAGDNNGVKPPRPETHASLKAGAVFGPEIILVRGKQPKREVCDEAFIFDAGGFFPGISGGPGG